MASRHVKAFQAMCYNQVHRGRVNQPDGSWKEASSPPNTNEHHMLAGYRMTGSMAGKKHGRKSKG